RTRAAEPGKTQLRALQPQRHDSLFAWMGAVKRTGTIASASVASPEWYKFTFRWLWPCVA
ncbi:MAG TPA: hypothetical protein VF493_21500, partial [Terriglobales bacterium]